MEVIWRIEVGDIPAFILVDDKGNSLPFGLDWTYIAYSIALSPSS